MLPGIQQFDLTSRVALVTGGSKGLGLAIADGLASAGAHIVVTSRNETEARSAAESIQGHHGVRTSGIRADVCQERDCDQVVQQVMDELGKIDILVNNAGINLRGPIDKLTLEQFRNVQQTNVEGTWLMSRAVLPGMKKQGWGRIINMASTLGLVGLEDRTPYATSKGAVIQMTRALGLEVAQVGIRVNAICPGPFLTPMNEPIANTEQTRDFIVGAVALKRWGELREIQGAAIFLASEAASFMVGSLITVDGGWTAR